MKSHPLTILGIAVIGSLICASTPAQEPATRPAHIDVQFTTAMVEGGKKVGSVAHKRNTKNMASDPLVNTFTGLNKRSSVVRIGYVGYANFQVAKNAKKDQLPGHVFAVQVLTGKKGVNIKTAEKNVTKLLVYRESPQILYEDENISVTISNKK